MTDRATRSELELLMSNLSFEHVWLYHLFAELHSFQAVGDRVNRSPNTVRDQMQSISDLFKSRFGHPLIAKDGRRYILTEYGSVMANRYRELSDWASATIKQHHTTRHVYDVPCTLNALGPLNMLRRGLPSSDFHLRPKPVRTADLQLYEDRRVGAPFAVGSILVSATQCFEPSFDDDGYEVEVARPVVSVFDNVEVVVLRNEPIHLLAPSYLDLPNPVQVSDFLGLGLTILIPRGGVVWRFMMENAPDWHERRPEQFLEIPQRDHGIEMLRHQMVDGGAMIVHGSRAALEEVGPGYRTWSIDERNGMRHRAITGVILDSAAECRHVSDFEVVRDTALKIFDPPVCD